MMVGEEKEAAFLVCERWFACIREEWRCSHEADSAPHEYGVHVAAVTQSSMVQ